METNSIFFVLKINKKLVSDKNFVKILKFELKRLNYFFPNSCWIDDQDNLLNKTDFKYEKIISSKINFTQFLNSNINSKIFFIDMINPMIDIDIIKNLHEKIINSNTSFKIIGAIPGTSPELVTIGNNYENLFSNNRLKENKLKKIYFDSQRKHNTQFDLNRSLRVKIFSKLIDKIPSLHSLSINEFIEKLTNDEIFNFVLDYGEDVSSIEINECLICGSKELLPLYLTTSQTMIGFLPNSLPLYYECQNCSLVLFRKQCDMDTISLFYDEYERPKSDESELITSRINNKGKSHFLEKIKGLELVESLNMKHVSMIDLGGGFGEFTCLAKTRNPSWDVTCADFNLEHITKLLNQYKIKTKSLNFLNDDFGQNYNLISALHVIEHIPIKSLLSFFNKIHNSLATNGFLLLTTPDYDSPLGKLFDYHLMYPPHHQSILSSSWISKFVKDHNLFRTFKQSSAAVLLENFESWFSYYEKTAPSQEFYSVVKLFNSFHNDPKLFQNIHDDITTNNLGSETILLLQKI